MLYIDLFSGCGGLALGLYNAGWQGLFAIEKSKDAFATLEHNLINNFSWPKWLERKNHDINIIIEKHQTELKALRGQISLVAGGPPCQGFSMVGKRTQNDKRNKLVDSYIKFIELVEPKIVFFENVKGFTIGFKNGDKRDLAYSSYITDKLRKLGYNINGKMVNFADYGVPQRRERFILVGTKHNNKAEIFFDLLDNNRINFLKSKNLDKEKITLSDAISDLLKSNGVIDSPDTKNFKSGIYAKPKTNYQRLMRENIDKKQKIVDSHRFTNHKKETIEKFKYILKFGKPNKNITDDIKAKFNTKKRTTILLCPNSVSPTIATLPDDYIHYCEPRVLTAREYARIQGFPDDYEFKGCYTTGGARRKTDVPRYTQIGNAIPPLFAEQVGLIIMEYGGHYDC